MKPGAGPVDVELLDVRYARAVDRYVATHPDGTPFHETRWLDLVRATFGFATKTLVAADRECIRGVLPLGLVAAPITGRRLVSVPYGVYGGVLASDTEAAEALDRAAVELSHELHVRYLEMRYLGAGVTKHASATIHETYRKDLPETPEEVLATIPRKARAEVRKGRNKHGLVFTSHPGLLDGFYELYCINKRQLGSPVFRKSFFRRALDLYGPRGFLHGVEKDGKLLAAVLSLRGGDTLYPYYSGALPEAGRLGASNLMYAALMEEAVRLGMKRFDFGRSRIGSGPASFKQHMGFDPTPLDYQFHFPYGGKPPTLSPGNPAMKLPQLVLSNLPAWMGPLVGPSLMRHVP
ncbi:MAG: peptidoglycan bridge formation protein FemAB [Planctomycetota bacterium]|nr:MAG: peptidoglycan bridge formation protein FemAB [Planctomycetota bacterium]